MPIIGIFASQNYARGITSDILVIAGGGGGGDEYGGGGGAGGDCPGSIATSSGCFGAM